MRHGRSFHGLAFNIAMDLEPFRRINPCGYAGLEVTSVVDCGGPASLDAAQAPLVAALAAQLGLAPVEVPEEFTPATEECG